MCGIAGILGTTTEPVDPRVLRKMCDALTHRGPDDQGFHLEAAVGLGQRRLSIIDPAGGHQPMSNEDGSVWVTFNGEIYNYQEIQPGLERAGHQFVSRSDTEVIVHAYERDGPDCLRHFRGMFAFAIWDRNRRSLFLARDRVGKKPLLYARAGQQLVFASELQGLLQHPSIDRRIDPIALDEYLSYGYVPAPRTIFQCVRKLPPGHHVTFQLSADGSIIEEGQPQRYWQLEYLPKLSLTEPEAVEQLTDLLTEAVRLRMIADVPLGALLSGGIDSGLIVALMSRLSSRPVKTFSIGFDEKDFNELPAARQVASQFGTEHHEEIVRPQALEILPLLVRHYGEPYADSSAIPSYYVARMTRQYVKVALSGDGGDESFAGYERYLGCVLGERYRKIPSVLRRWAIEPLSRLIPQGLSQRNRLAQARRFLEVAAQPLPQRYGRWLTFFSESQKESLYGPDLRQQLGAARANTWLEEQFTPLQERGLHPLDQCLAVDVQTYLPYDLLSKMDIASMANSLEVRSPLLDHRVMEFAARLPTSMKLHSFRLKHLLKQFAARLFPPEHLKRRKMGFGVPVGQWLRKDLQQLIQDCLLSEHGFSRGYFRPDAIRTLVREHQSGQRDHTHRLWALLWLELWHREVAGD